jgi:hypothetical protein
MPIKQKPNLSTISWLTWLLGGLGLSAIYLCAMFLVRGPSFLLKWGKLLPNILLWCGKIMTCHSREVSCLLNSKLCSWFKKMSEGFILCQWIKYHSIASFLKCFYAMIVQNVPEHFVRILNIKRCRIFGWGSVISYQLVE